MTDDSSLDAFALPSRPRDHLRAPVLASSPSIVWKLRRYGKRDR